MALLFRLRRMLTFTNPAPSLSLLHHHHRPLSSTSGADSSFNSKPNPSLLLTPSSSSATPFLLRQTTTHTVKTPALLRHRLRLFSTSNTASGAGDNPNSNRPSPTLLSELRVAIKQLSTSLNNRDPASSSSSFPFIPSFNSNEEDAEQNVPPIDTKLEQLKVSVLSLRLKQHTDKQRIHEMDQSRIAFSDKVYEDLAKLDEHSQDEETHDKMAGTLVLQLTWLRDRTTEVAELSRVLVNSRLEALYEIAENLYKLREDLQDDEVWKELDEGLRKVQEMEMKEFEMVAEKFGGLIGSMIQQTNDLSSRKRR